MIRRALRRPLLSSLSAMTAAGVIAGGIALTSNNTPTASAAGLDVQAAPATPTPTLENQQALAGQQRLAAAAAQHRAELRAAASRRAAAAAQAAAEKAAAQKRAQAERERQAALARASRAKQRAAIVSQDPRSAARALLGDYGFDSGQFGCLDSLWQKESGWNPHASNPSSGAYGIPQALPGSKMGSVASDWHDNPVTQIKWGLQYIKSTYGTPCSAWNHSQASGWY